MKKLFYLLSISLVFLLVGCINPFANVFAPSNPSPADGEVNIQETAFTFSWSTNEPSGDGVVYDLYLGTGPYPECIAVGLNKTSYKYDFSNKILGRTYYWKVVARNNFGGRTEGPLWSFKTGPELLASFGEYGMEEGELFEPFGIAVDSLGNIYVTDNRIGYGVSAIAFGPLGTVVKFDSEGNFLKEWSLEIAEYGSMVYDIVVDSNDDLYVVSEYPSDDGLSHVAKYTPEGTLLAEWGIDYQWELSPDFETAGHYYYVRSRFAAVDSQDNLYLTYYDSERIRAGVMVFTSEGATVTEFGSWGSDEGEFFIPEGIAIDSNDDVYIADRENRRVQKFTKDGTFIETFGEFGKEIYDIQHPYYLKIDSNDNMYVYDGPIKIFDSDSDFKFAWQDEDNWSTHLMTTDPQGYIYVVDRSMGEIHKFSPLK